MGIVAWVKKNKLATLLILVVAYFIYRNYIGVRPLSMKSASPVADYSGSFGAVSPSLGGTSPGISNLSLPDIYQPEYTPQTDTQNRLVIQESNMSLLVKDVVDTRNKILEYTKSEGGYMVNSSTTSPEDSPTSTVTIRIPTEKLQQTLDFFHSLSIKVVSENLTGRDVTDQYVDIDARLKTYESTKAKYEAILAQATEISDITNLTQQIINVQNQIDSLKGQKKSLEQNAALAKLTIYLATDEIALPYTPSETFRPNIIFKLAVRAMIGSLRKVATYVIWVGVYSVIWIPVLAACIFYKRWRKKKLRIGQPTKPQ